MEETKDLVVLKFISPNNKETLDIFRNMSGLDEDITEQVYSDEFLKNVLKEAASIPLVKDSGLLSVDEELDVIVIPPEAIDGQVTKIDTENFEITIEFNDDADKLSEYKANPENYLANFIFDEDIPDMVAVEIFDKRVLSYKAPQVKIKYHTDKYPGLMEVWRDDVGDLIDLRCAKNIMIEEGEYTLIPLGISTKLPPGYHAEVVPRSSTFKEYGIIQTNGVGIIDNSYCGDDDEWFMPVYATRGVLIEQNKRIAQFKLVKNQPIDIIRVDHLDDDNRGGFGSTGDGSEDTEEE